MLGVNLYRNAPRVLLIAVTAGFAFIVIELVGINHTASAKIVGVASAAIGAALGLLGLAAEGGLRKVLTILFVVLSLAGIFGVITHGGARGFRQQGVSQVPATASEDRTVGRALRSFAILPPALAPLMLTGLSLLGATALLMGAGQATLAANPGMKKAMA